MNSHKAEVMFVCFLRELQVSIRCDYYEKFGRSERVMNLSGVVKRLRQKFLENGSNYVGFKNSDYS